MHFPGTWIAASRYSRIVRKLLRENSVFFLGASVGALALRLLFVVYFPAVVDDSRFYANIAGNWLQRGVYGVTDSGQVVPTFSRLPGYPGFLAIIFAVFGVDNFRAVLLVQVLFDLGTCFLIADIARRVLSERAARVAFLLAALCPFLVNYAAAALTETLEIFFTALAFDLALCGLWASEARSQLRLRQVRIWLGCGVAIGAAILLRPDGGILLVAIGGYLLWQFARGLLFREIEAMRAMLIAGLLIGTGAAAPLVPWTVRNFITLHRFEPLAHAMPTTATSPS